MEPNVFEEMAKRYDTEERVKLANIVVEEVKKELQDSTSKTLIDYGSGTGLVSLELTDMVKSVLLVDSSEQMVEVAKSKITQRGFMNADVLYSNFTQGAPNLKADIVLMSLVLLHIPDTESILQELFTILNDGGELIIVDFDKNENISHPKVHNGFVHEELKDQLSEAGFRSTEVRTFHHGHQIFMKQDASMFIASSSK
ncbi:class I SAM-dependent methyltransferase [Rossellomorea aquimaris]|uniref:class I SAM-dependent methyltransferase n=1 Tax=Rossellomorea aquimaris TaxID=189382 RepID=UPI001CFDBDD3|nr:class I SAM-dependent methyltransferase [Rossellomorea aquimaris]